MGLRVSVRVGSRTIPFSPVERNKSSDIPGVFFPFLFYPVPVRVFRLPAGSLAAIPGVSGFHKVATVNCILLPATRSLSMKGFLSLHA